jgi:transcriptional regulator with XRE-family HTH domain
MNIGAAIQHFRRAAKLNQETLAQAVGLNQSDISRIERGQQGFDISKLESFSVALGIPVVDLVTYAVKPDPLAARWARLYDKLPTDERLAALRILEPRDSYHP